MLLLPYLYESQIGSVRKTQSTFTKPDLDFLLSRLVCGLNDVFITRGEHRIPVPPFTCKFRKDKESDLLAVANEDGEVYLIDTDKGKGVVKNFIAHNNAIFDICWLPDKNYLLTGSGDFRCCLFDMATCKKVSTFRYHTASIKSVDVFQDGRGTTLAAGSKDGSISIWDIREEGLHSKPAIVINQAHERTTYNPNKKAVWYTHTSSSVSAVTFRDSYTLASAGVGDSVIKIWDLRKTYDKTNLSIRRKPRESITFSDNKVQGFGYTSLVFNSLYTKLYACSAANKIFEIDCHSYTKKYERFTGLKSSTYFVKMSLSHDDQYIASGSSDNKAYIWKTSKPGLPLFELAGHTAEVTSVAWGAYNNTKIATCGDDHKVLLWKTKNSDHTDENPDKEQVAASRPYSSGITSDSSDTISIFLPVTPMNHTKKSPNFKSPPTSKNIRSYFSPLPPTPVTISQFNQSPSNIKRESAEPRSSYSPSNESGKSTEPQSDQSPSNLKREYAEPQSSHYSSNQSGKSAEPQSSRSPNNLEKEPVKLKSSQSPSNLNKESKKPQPSNHKGESGYVYSTILTDSPSNQNRLSASVSSPPQYSHSQNTESAIPHTISSPGSQSEELSSVLTTQSGNSSEDITSKESIQQQSIQSRDNSNNESTSLPQSCHTPKREFTSIPDSPRSSYNPNSESTSDSHSTNSPNGESTKPESIQREINPNKDSTSNSNFTQSSHSPSSLTRESASVPDSTNSPNSDFTQSSHSPSYTTRESTSVPHSAKGPNSDSTQFIYSLNSPTTESTSLTSPHFTNSLDADSTQTSHRPSSPTTESTSISHSTNSPNSESGDFQPSCNSLSTPVVQREPLSPRKNISGSSAAKGSGVGKENGSSVKKSNGQTKRKLDVNNRACKYHLDGCGRTKGKTRCGKRIVSYVVPEKNNLTDYFSVIQTPDKHQNSAL